MYVLELSLCLISSSWLTEKLGVKNYIQKLKINQIPCIILQIDSRYSPNPES